MSPWRPLLEGDDAARAREVIDGIADDLAARPIDLGSTGAGLARGEPGIGLVFAYLARALDEPRYAEQAEERLMAALEHAAEHPDRPYLWYGLAGVVWAAEQATALLEPSDDDDEDDPYADVDEILAGFVDDMPEVPFELLGGLCGLGVYALERMPKPGARQLLERVVDRLLARAEIVSTADGDGLRWVTRFSELTPGEQELFPGGYCSLGVAHGNPGPLAILGAASAWGVRAADTRDAIEASKRWLFRQRIPSSPRSQFPALLEEPEPHHRASWCYGDAGIASVIAAVADALDIASWRDESAELIDAIASRQAEQCGLSDDANLCHGAVGLGHMLNRAAQRSGRGDLAESARRWYRRGMAMVKPGEGVGGVMTVERDEVSGEMVPMALAGLLDGAAGVAAGLAAGLSTLEPIWDRAFLLTLATPDRGAAS